MKTFSETKVPVVHKIQQLGTADPNSVFVCQGLQFTARDPHFTVLAQRINVEYHFRTVTEIKTLLHAAKALRS